MLPLVRALSAADTSLAELSGMGASGANPHLLMAPYMRQEAGAVSRIEGTQASLSDRLFEELRPAEATESQPMPMHARCTYVRALEHGLRRLGELPLSLRLVRELHETLMQGVRGGDR